METTINEHRQLLRRPIFRKLRVFAVDPGFTARFETAIINEMTLHLSWEKLAPGPAGEYIAVVDEDDRGKLLYHPIDLNRPELLAQDGLTPSDGDPHFHQQMVYAVAMRTILTFERALGRLTHWPQPKAVGNRPVPYRRQLKLIPHSKAEMNAYFDRDRGVFHFGYFVSEPQTSIPNTQVFTCLSQDVIAHELTHALMMGMNFQTDPDETNPDNEAFHEAFADLVALFLHFGRSNVLRAQIAAVRGRLGERSTLGAVALQFGQAIDKPDGLRNALGTTDKDGNWHCRVPNPALYQTLTEPHDRGDILVGAVFDAFRKIYESRVADLRRLASKGTGELPAGSLHPDLVNRMTDEAARTAEVLLEMCIRALDFLPPVKITFGDFLRAVVTADYDAVPADPLHYRVAFAEAFRTYGLCPEISTVSPLTLLLPRPETAEEASVLRDFMHDLSRKYPYWIIPRDPEKRDPEERDPEKRAREKLWNLLEEYKVQLKAFLAARGTFQRLGPINLTRPFEVHSIYPRGHTNRAGSLNAQWVIKLVQANTSSGRPRSGRNGNRVAHLVGTTLVVDANTGLIRYRVDKESRAPSKAPTKAPGFLPPKKEPVIPSPSERRLRVFAFDPTMGVALETAGINEVTLEVPWERDLVGRDVLQPGPVGEYLEVVDRDPASKAFYAPVNLNDARLLAQNGLVPSESNPQFHQQMVYAVAMRTIRTFENALGRVALWSPRPAALDSSGNLFREEGYIQRLRLYPHALREANAYYSPAKKAVLFGYFPGTNVEVIKDATPLTVFTCLSHDIIAHEVTHALLDGMHRRFNEPSNPDVLAFHEAFADIVALFLHFSLPEVLRHQVATTRGDLESQNRLGELAQQFGQATGKRGALRSALGVVDPRTGKWQRTEPDPDAIQRLKEPHDRGAILVAAVFDAFLTIYKAAVADLLRIASDGTGIVPEGHLHPDLVNRLADEAARSADYVLNMCIRALDYCPPVDITFGDYLRAVLTADFEFNPVDEAHRRVAFVEAFRKRGIVPEGVRTLAVDGLLWRPIEAAPNEDENFVLSEVKTWAPDIASWNLTKDRKDLYALMKKKRAALHSYLRARMKREDIITGGIDPIFRFEVHSIRPSLRTDWEGRPHFQWVIELTQRVEEYDGDWPNEDGSPAYYFRGGCTMVVDAETGKIRFSIKKPLSKERRDRQRHYFLEDGMHGLAATYFGGPAHDCQEPFAMLHRFTEISGEGP
jgi:hypothetical protein